MKLNFKDSVLSRLAQNHNVAQFVSFGPNSIMRHSAVVGLPPDAPFADVRAAADALLRGSIDGAVRVRSFAPDAAQNRPFTAAALAKAEDVEAYVSARLQEGLHVIINESLRVDDGGVSGVIHGDLVEFSPNAVPRCVESLGDELLSANREIGIRLLATVYGFEPDLDFLPSERVEFSVHPSRCGYRQKHTVLWELEALPVPANSRGYPVWPNNFSRFIGDKAFGLLIADMAGMWVPRTTVISRTVRPFSFGRPTGTGDSWIRTCPAEPRRGKYRTLQGWSDPFRLMQEDDPDGTEIPSVLDQEGVNPRYSGSTWRNGGELTVEGVEGVGDEFMSSLKDKEGIPGEVIDQVRRLFAELDSRVPAEDLEWVFDGQRVWVVQMHRDRGLTTERGWIFSGEADGFRTFHANEGLSALRSLVLEARSARQGIIVVGNIGLTSHMCQLLRDERIPSRLKRSD